MTLDVTINLITPSVVSPLELYNLKFLGPVGHQPLGPGRNRAVQEQHPQAGPTL